ncbi:translocation/assembly module TamB domain-containing protein [Terrihabitans sp. B22-R8]|uniref:translocation/assembly module TamB domain-containing protein n=1 Tax=Terrihabitans sp. B22-R8 TaxID=3425128 RepID=UPI00403CDB2C
MRKLLAGLVLATGLAGAGAALVVGVPAYTQEDDQSALGSLLSKVLSTPTSKVHIGRIEGALSSDSTIHDVRISDADGEWLIVEKASLSWSRLALLRRRLQVNDLTITGLNVLRKPLPSEEEPAPEEAGPILPELPVKVLIEKFTLDDLRLGEPVLGISGVLDASGHAELGDPKEGLKLNIDARRQDAPGAFVVELGFVPNTQQLDLRVDLDEPERGLIAHAADIPGLPPVSLKIAGSGPLDGWSSNLNFDAGPDIGAQGQANLVRNDQIRRLNLDLKSRIAGLMPAPLAPVVRNTTALTGSVVFGDDGGYAIEEFAITSEVARLGVSGFITANRNLDLNLVARALPSEGGRTRAGQAEIGHLALDARLTGPMASPRLNGTLDAGEVVLPEGRLDTLTALVRMEPVEGTKNFTLDADVKARGLRPTDRDLARALGDRIDLVAKGTLDEQRVLNLEEGRLDIPTASASLDGRFGTNLIDANARARIDDLAAFSGIAGRPVDGAANLTARLTGDPRRTIDAALDGRLSDLATGTPIVDGLFGRDVALTGTVSQVRGGFALDNLRLDGAHLKAVANGRATQTNADVALVVDLPDIRRADARLSGRAKLDARLTGSLRAPGVTTDATLADGSAMGRPIRNLALNVLASDLKGTANTNVSLAGDIGGKPARGTVNLARLPEGGWNVPALDVAIGTVTAKGAVRLDAANRAAGNLTVRAQDLDDISPLVLARLGGKLDADIVLDAPEGRQNANVKARGERLVYAGNAVRNFTADARASDLYGRPVMDGVIEASEIAAGGQSLENVRLVANGTPSGSDLDLTARARGFDLAGKGRLVPGTPNRLDLASFSARRGGRQIALAGPARIAFTDGGVTLSDLVIAVESGRIAASGRAGSTLDLSVDVRAVPLSAAEIVTPGLGIAGTASGQARITGSASAPSGTYAINLAGITAPQTREYGLPPLAVDARGRLDGGRATIDGTVNAGRAGSMKVAGSAPLSAAGNLDVRANGRLDAAVANTFLGASGQRVTGTAAVDVRVTGTAAQPQINGTLGLDGGTFTDQAQGVQLNAITARLIARGDVITVERLSAVTPNGGTMSGSGRIEVDPAAGFPANIRIGGQRAQLVASDIVTAVADLDLTITGPVARTPRISGRIGLVSMDVAVPDRLPATLQPLPETKHVGARGVAKQRIARQMRANRGKGQAPFLATLDIVLEAPNRIFVRGRGLNAELGGDLRLTGTSASPVAMGAFELRRGRFDIIGQRIDLNRGRLTFAGDLMPELDFLAETTAGDVTAQVGVTGNASAPDFVFTSNPDLPQDEVLSRLLFGKAAGGLSAGQALQLAQAVAQFSGAGGGPGVFESMRKGLGVDSLDITTGAEGGVAVGASRYINDRTSIGVKAGSTPEDTGVTLNFDVTRNIKIQAGAGADGSASGGVGIEREY